MADRFVAPAPPGPSEPGPGSAAETGLDWAPWWAWGFVAAMPAALLGLVTPWLGAVSPLDGRGFTYSAWTDPWFGLIGPLYLLVAGGQWFGALRGRRAPPSRRDWRGVSSWMSFGSAAYVPIRTASPERRLPASAMEDPMRAGARWSAWYGVVALVLLMVNAVLFQPYYYRADVRVGAVYEERRDIPVHSDFGFYCLLLAAVMFVATGVLGVVLQTRVRWPDRPAGPDLYLLLGAAADTPPRSPEGAGRAPGPGSVGQDPDGRTSTGGQVARPQHEGEATEPGP